MTHEEKIHGEKVRYLEMETWRARLTAAQRDAETAKLNREAAELRKRLAEVDEAKKW